MRISTVGYSAKQGVKNIGRNKMFSLASVATMAACIFVFGLFFSIIMNFQYIVHKAEEGVAITVFFNDDATQEQIDNIGAQLKKQDGVKEIKYVSADEAWETFKDQYFGNLFPSDSNTHCDRIADQENGYCQKNRDDNNRYIPYQLVHAVQCIGYGI